jgi:phenylalanyl-tRNA synthetase beta chain
MMRLPVPEGTLSFENPYTETMSTVRTRVLPDLLAFLSRNTHHDYPQSVYEVGEVVEGGLNGLRAAAASAHARAGFTQAKSLAEGLLRDLGRADAEVEPLDHPSYIPGRCARALVDGGEAATFGEVHPGVLEAFGIAQPTVAVELDLRPLH